MALQDIKLPRLDAYTALVDRDDIATITFSQWWDRVASQLEDGINGINEALNAAAAAQVTADGAQGTADTAVTDAATAQTTANGAVTDAAAAQATAAAAAASAATKVSKDVGASWSSPSGTASRGALSSYSAPTASIIYDATQIQAVMDALQAASRATVAIITDLRSNHALTP